MTFDWQTASAFVLTLPAIATIAWWLLALRAMQKTERKLGSADQGLSIGGIAKPDPVLVVVPAHNEQAVISKLISSLRGQDYPDFRVVLALDRCSDATLPIALETIAADERFEVIEVGQCPPDWAGKVHAIHQAVSHAKLQPNQLLIFADADTVFDRSCIRSCAAVLRDRKLDALSLLSTLTYERRFERLAQAPAAFELLVRYPPLKASRDFRRRPFANGQFILIRAEAYQQIGTHAAFRDELLEDLAIARALWKEKLRIQVLPAGAMLTCRMYPHAEAFERGWRRIFIEAAKRKPSRLKAWALAALLRGVFAPLYCLGLVSAGTAWAVLADPPTRWLFAGAALVGFVACLCWQRGVAHYLRRAGITRLRTRLVVQTLWPLGCIQLSGILRQAAAELEKGVPTGWAGKSYKRPAR